MLLALSLLLLTVPLSTAFQPLAFSLEDGRSKSTETRTRQSRSRPRHYVSQPLMNNEHDHYHHHHSETLTNQNRPELFGFRRWLANSWQQPQRANRGTQLGAEAIATTDKDDRMVLPTRPPPPSVLNERGEVRYAIADSDELDSYFADEAHLFRDEKTGEIRYGDLLDSLHVKGDTQVIGSPDRPNYVHPVAKLMHARKRQLDRQQQQQQRDGNDGEEEPQFQSMQSLGDANSTATSASSLHKDGCRLALAIEGGGMRGCISAGMVCAVAYLNLTDTIDVVYGSSAGTIVGAYLITGQVKWLGPEVYYDQLTTAGRAFIDTRRLMRAIGFGLLDPRLLKDVVWRRRAGKPVLNLPFLLKRTVQVTKPLNWTKFVEKQAVQPLKVVASGLKSEKAVVMDMEQGHFETLEELTDCMHASCLLPGIAGPLMNLDTTALKDKTGKKKKLVMENNLQGDQYEPLADALVYEPLPYRSALNEGATHVLVIRSRPDGKDLTGKSSFFEGLIYRRFFLRKNRLPRIYRYFRRELHKLLYAKDVLRLNQDAESERDPYNVKDPHLMTIAVAPDSPEVTRLETGREAIFEGLRRGFARAYDCLVEDPAERGRGAQVAMEYFPDEILDYDPLLLELEEEAHQKHSPSPSSRDTTPLNEDSGLKSDEQSAFHVYMRKYSVTPKAWKRENTGTEKRNRPRTKTQGIEEDASLLSASHDSST